MSAHVYTQAEVEAVATALGGGGKAGDGWTCRCPSHDDGKASLSLSLGEGGRLLTHCHAGCTPPAVFDGLRRAGVLLNGDARPAEPRPRARPRGRIVATYPYVDEAGVLLFEVVRREPKGFSQRRPDPARPGEHLHNLNGTRRLLYRLPEVLAAGEVVIVEGEKDADALARLGLVATTSPQGADKWRAEYAGALVGKRVAILPDNDEPGRKHAATIAAALAGRAAGVKVVALDGLPEKGDVSDWLAAGHTADELRVLIAKALEWEPARREEPEGEADGQAGEGRTAKGLRPAQWTVDLQAAVDELNERYLVARMGGRGVIASLTRDDDLDRERLVFSRRQDILLLYNHRHVQVGENDKGAPIIRDLGMAWLQDERRRTYDRIALIPKGPTPPDVYNLWRGFGVEPTKGEWPLLREHLLDTVCDGNATYYDYLVRWCAYCVQHPERRSEVAVVLRGLKGTGKGSVGQVLVGIFRDHALQVANPRHLTGHFNAHLVDALFLFVDEAFWAGDKAGEGVLKALITERTLMIEPKGVDPFTMPNRLKILMASNNDWVVPATADERRFFVLDVSNKRRGDFPYFVKLYTALDEGELAAFLHHLLTLDLVGFNIRDVPTTGALDKQKLIGADSVTRFWEDCLREGAIIGTPEKSWPGQIPTQVLHAAYLEHARDHGERHPASDTRMGERLTQLCEGCTFRRVRPRKADNSPRLWERQLGTIEEHRAAFERALHMAPNSIAWTEDVDG